jgi:hypothetical protein
MCVVHRQPAGSVVLAGQRRLSVGADTNGKDRGSDDRVVRGFVELVHEVQVVEGIDFILAEPGLFVQLSQRADRDPILVL